MVRAVVGQACSIPVRGGSVFGEGFFFSPVWMGPGEWEGGRWGRLGGVSPGVRVFRFGVSSVGWGGGVGTWLFVSLVPILGGGLWSVAVFGFFFFVFLFCVFFFFFFFFFFAYFSGRPSPSLLVFDLFKEKSPSLVPPYPVRLFLTSQTFKVPPGLFFSKWNSQCERRLFFSPRALSPPSPISSVRSGYSC